VVALPQEAKLTLNLRALLGTEEEKKDVAFGAAKRLALLESECEARDIPLQYSKGSCKLKESMESMAQKLFDYEKVYEISKLSGIDGGTKARMWNTYNTEPLQQDSIPTEAAAEHVRNFRDEPDNAFVDE
jgi:hypothetical protein